MQISEQGVFNKRMKLMSHSGNLTPRPPLHKHGEGEMEVQSWLPSPRRWRGRLRWAQAYGG